MNAVHAHLASSAIPRVLMLAGVLALAGCGRSEVPADPPPTPRPPTAFEAEGPPQDLEEVIESGPAAGGFSFEAYAYDCEGTQVTVRPGDGELTVNLPQISVTLPQVEAASGARYSDGDTGFWGKEIDSGILTLEGNDIQCQLDRRETPWVDARARGAVFRGVGQEPAWHLEVHAERIVMVYQYGKRRVVVPNAGVIEDPEGPVRRWQATTEAHELQVTVEDRGCTDVMSGESYPARVTVKLDGRDYAGCGRDLD
jgi:uncharacterized membrane protein/membrane-bound inhibitor of C-type lysozyme